MTGLDTSDFVGRVGYNWHGSFPVFVADAKFEPNFRMFDMFGDVSLSSEDLHNKLMRNDEGSNPHGSIIFGTHRLRGHPLIFSSITIGFLSALVTQRWSVYRQRQLIANLWLPINFTAAVFVASNILRHGLRERAFNNDFERNQYFAYDEIKARRDEERVRRALADKEFATDPITEYRVKAWQVSRAAL